MLMDVVFFRSDGCDSQKTDDSTQTASSREEQTLVRSGYGRGGYCRAIFSAIWTRGPRYIMQLFLVVAVCSLAVQLYQLESLDHYKRPRTCDPNVWAVLLAFLTTMAGVVGFGPPYAPLFIGTASLAVCGVVSFEYPGLVEELEKMAVAMILGGLAIEHIYNGELHAPRS